MLRGDMTWGIDCPIGQIYGCFRTESTPVQSLEIEWTECCGAGWLGRNTQVDVESGELLV